MQLSSLRKKPFLLYVPTFSYSTKLSHWSASMKNSAILMLRKLLRSCLCTCIYNDLSREQDCQIGKLAVMSPKQGLKSTTAFFFFLSSGLFSCSPAITFFYLSDRKNQLPSAETLSLWRLLDQDCLYGFQMGRNRRGWGSIFHQIFSEQQQKRERRGGAGGGGRHWEKAEIQVEKNRLSILVIILSAKI